LRLVGNVRGENKSQGNGFLVSQLYGLMLMGKKAARLSTVIPIASRRYCTYEEEKRHDHVMLWEADNKMRLNGVIKGKL